MNVPNINAWGEMWDRTFVQPASNRVLEVLIYGEKDKKKVKEIWNKLGLGKLKFIAAIGFCWLVECSEKDVARLSGAIRYQEAGTITSVGENRKYKMI